MLVASGCQASTRQPTCTDNGDCSEGFYCGKRLCQPVPSSVGDPCDRESDCGPGQTCAPATFDSDSDGVDDAITAVCQAQRIGLPLGASCASDDACSSGACALGQCAELCFDGNDCHAGTVCAGVPRAVDAPRGQDSFLACLPATGTLSLALPELPPGTTLRVPVPSNAISLTLEADVADPRLLVGLTRLVSPSNRVLYEGGSGGVKSQLAASVRLRHTPSTEIVAVRIPAASDAPLEPGVYEAAFAAWQPSGTASGVRPRVRAIYQLGAGGRQLDVRIHVMDLAGHACAGASDLTAAIAADDGPVQDAFLPSWRAAFGRAGIAIANVELDDVVGHPELDALAPDEVGELLALGGGETDALDVFLVRSLQPLGVLALAGGVPGPIEPGTSHSGIVLSADALCLMGWDTLGRVAAQAAGSYLGLHETVDVNGSEDMLDSTSARDENLMYFRVVGEPNVTAEQRHVLYGSPLLR